MDAESISTYLSALTQGELFAFEDWPNESVPRVASGVYTVWNDSGEYLYVGMAGRSLTAEAISNRRANPGARAGLWDRLNSHASGRRSGDQFCVYVADRLVFVTLTPETIAAIGRGEESLDRLVKNFIRRNLTYRSIVTEDNVEAFEIERQGPSAVKWWTLGAGCHRAPTRTRRAANVRQESSRSVYPCPSLSTRKQALSRENARKSWQRNRAALPSHGRGQWFDPTTAHATSPG